MNPLRLWMLKATTNEQKMLASTAGISRNYLYRLGDGARDASSLVAGRIEEAAEKIRRLSKGRLPRVTRSDVSSVCNECIYAQRCIKRRK